MKGWLIDCFASLNKRVHVSAGVFARRAEHVAALFIMFAWSRTATHAVMLPGSTLPAAHCSRSPGQSRGDRKQPLWAYAAHDCSAHHQSHHSRRAVVPRRRTLWYQGRRHKRCCDDAERAQGRHEASAVGDARNAGHRCAGGHAGALRRAARPGGDGHWRIASPPVNVPATRPAAERHADQTALQPVWQTPYIAKAEAMIARRPVGRGRTSQV